MRQVSWWAMLVSCAPAASTEVAQHPEPRTQPSNSAPAKLDEEPAGPADAALIWDEASAGNIDRARRALAWFRAHPPEKIYAGPDYRPEVICSHDAARCAFGLTFPAGTGVTDEHGNALRRIGAIDRPFAFVGKTRLVFMSGTPGGVIDADTGQIILDLPEVGWSTVDIGDEHIVFGLDTADEQRVGVWAVESRSMLFDKTSELGNNPTPTLAADATTVLVSTDTGAYAWNIEDGSLIAAASHPGVGQPITAQGAFVALATYGKQGAEVRLVDRSGKIVARSRACARPRVVELSKSGKFLAVGGEPHDCVLSVPSLSPVWKSAALPVPKDDWAKQNSAWFTDDERVVAFGSGSGEWSLFEIGGARRHHAAGRAKVRPTRDGAIAIVNTREKTLVLLRDFQEQSRRTLSEAELADTDQLAELAAPREPDRGSELAQRLRPRLCMVHGHAFPPALCDETQGRAKPGR